MDRLFRDIRLAFRSLLRAPSFSALSVATLAIGIGATALMLTAANAAFLRPLPFTGADPVARIWQVSQRSNQIAIAYDVWRDLQAELTTFAALAALQGSGTVNLTNGGDAERAEQGVISRQMFSTLGVAPVLGREFSAEEATPNGPAAVIISDALWARFFARDPGVLSKTISIEGVPHPIVGVMPPGAEYPASPDLWTTFERGSSHGTRTAHNFEVVGRLKPGISLRQAQAELDTAVRTLHARHADMAREGHAMRVAELREDLLGPAQTPLYLLLGAVACVLLIGCANVVNLLLARSVSRETQTTLRIALGATRSDLVRLFVVESLLLALAGGALGAMLMFWAGDLAGGLIPPSVAPPGALEPDFRVFAAVMAVMLVVGTLCGLVPASHASRLQLRGTLAAGSPSVAGEPRAMRILIGAEVAVGCLLLVGAGLLVRSLINLESIDPGFRRAGVIAAPFALGAADDSAYASPSARAQFYDRLLERVRVIPGVQAAGVTSSFPFGRFSPSARLQEEGSEAPTSGVPETNYRVIGGDYFKALDIPLEAGRFFDDTDRAGGPHVAIVNETAVRALWSDGRAIGRRVRMRNVDGVEDFATIVGVVNDIRTVRITRPPVPEIYFPYVQRPRRTWGMTLVLQGTDDGTSVAAMLRAAVREVDPTIPVEIALAESHVATQLAPARFRTGLLAAFGVVALVLSACGIFGVVSYSVARRTREMGIRLAIGASAGAVRTLVLRRALAPVAIGLFVGTTAALLGSRLMAGLMFEVKTVDPISYVSAVGVLFAAAVLAALWPAYRATRVNPITALRAE